MKVIGVVGLPASGKGEFSRIARSLGIPVVVMGDVIRRAVEEAGIPVTDRNMGEMAGKLRKEGGMAAVAQRCVPVINGHGSGVVVVDGIRGDAEVELFREQFPCFFLIGIDAPFEVRLARLSCRGRADDVKDPEDLIARDRREISWGLGRALAGADYLLINGESMEEFERDATRLLNGIRGDPCT